MIYHFVHQAGMLLFRDVVRLHSGALIAPKPLHKETIGSCQSYPPHPHPSNTPPIVQQRLWEHHDPCHLCSLQFCHICSAWRPTLAVTPSFTRHSQKPVRPSWGGPRPRRCLPPLQQLCTDPLLQSVIVAAASTSLEPTYAPQGLTKVQRESSPLDVGGT